MTKWLVLAVPSFLLCIPAADASTDAAPPAGVVTVTAGGLPLTLWPYTFQQPAPPSTPSDPVNLVFLDTDPREIRQALMSLDGARPGFPPELGRDCRWSDAMGNDQASWTEDAGWVGGEVQLACVVEGAPLGNPFRVHLRLFRHGELTLGAAHFEMRIPGTAEHEVLSWDFARTFVTLDMTRAGVLIGAPSPVTLAAPGTFRTVRRPIYDALINGGAQPLLALLGLVPPPQSGPVPIPTNGAAMVLAPSIQLAPVQAKIDSAYDVNYDVVAPKPFCNGPADYVRLLGPIHFTMQVHTNPSGKYERTYVVSGSLTVIPLLATAAGLVPNGQPLSAEVSEYHHALLTDNHGQVRELVSRTLLGDVPQTLLTIMNAGQVDDFSATVTCEAP